MMKLLFALAAVCAASTAVAQASPPAAPAAPAECVRAAPWHPCGPDRALSETELAGWRVKAGQTTKIEFTGGMSGRKFFINL